MKIKLISYFILFQVQCEFNRLYSDSLVYENSITQFTTAKQMKLKQLGANKTLLVLKNGVQVFLSYETPVAFQTRKL